MKDSQIAVAVSWIVGIVFLVGAKYYGFDWVWSALIGLFAMSAVAAGAWNRNG